MLGWSLVVTMPNWATSGTVLLALWVTLGGCDPPAGPGCDNGKLYLDRDLPEMAVHWECSTSPWTAKRHPSVDTVYHPEPVRLICMDRAISYNHSIPNSGAYRPIRAESGEYLYCPPQRWINNLHHKATVLLFHPCASSQERQLLSMLGRSCLSNYIITPHHQLSKRRPIALVSWARTLELSTVAVSDTCDWLETTMSTSNGTGDARPSRRYDYLLMRSAEQEPKELPANRKESVRRCCQEVITKSSTEAKARPIRAEHTNGTKRDIQNLSRTLGPTAGSPSGNRTAFQSNRQNTDWHRPSGSNALRTQSVGKVQETSHGHPLGTETQILSSKYEASDSVGVLEEKNEVVEVKERELEHRLDSDAQQKPGSATGPPSSADCSKDSEPRPAEVSKGFSRTQRSDEAIWAAAALGFLLVLLTLSVLHTRLYRQWRTAPSLYWHDPQLDYDSVADVIRRRLRIAKRRRKRSRRQECVLLASSSSSDEQP